jgi:excisionase family DNA binding protein
VRVGAAAKVLGIHVDTLRKLDRQGLIRLPRDWRGQRRLTDRDLDRLRAFLYPQVADRVSEDEPQQGRT